MPGQVLASEVADLDSASTVQREVIAIRVRDGNVFLDGDAHAVATDIMTSTGVIHVIDAVVLPPSAA